MLPAYLKIENVDPEIRDLIARINYIPFLDTISCCAGHPEQYGRHRDGLLSFQIDNNYEDAKDFLRRLWQLRRRYSFVSLRAEITSSNDRNRYMRYFGRASNIFYALELSVWDVPPEDKEKRSGRKEEFNQVWQEFLQLVEDFMREHGYVH